MTGLFRYYRCRKCSAAYAVSSADKDLHLLYRKLPCTTTGCKWFLTKTSVIEKKPKVITAVALFSALGGAGLPEEKAAAALKQIKTCFVGAKVKSVSGDSHAGRTILRSISFDNGLTMHLATSTKGATIFKVTEDAHVSR